MKVPSKVNMYKRLRSILVASLLLQFLVSCGNPHKVDVSLREVAPENKVTSFSQAILDLGKMTQIYNTVALNIMAKDVGDVTGTSAFTSGEIPRDITEMVKSTLNAVGGNVVYIPYDPAFFQNTYATGYSTFENKIIPDVVMTGAITEFDRGLETRGKNTDFDAEASVSGLPKWVPSDKISLETGAGAKTALSRITLDFNLIDFQTLSGIARMQAVNSIKVDKATRQESIGFSLLGPTIGLKGTVKKVQGRHAAVRLLVELSVIQIVSKYLALPYWNLIPGAQEDPVIIGAVTSYYYSLSEPEKIVRTQELLRLHGYQAPLNGELDSDTVAALQQFDSNFQADSSSIDKDTYLNLYISVPITDETLGERTKIAKFIESIQAEQTAVVEEQTPVEMQATVVSAPAEEPVAAPQEAAEEEVAASEPERRVKPRVRTFGGGRILSESDW